MTLQLTDLDELVELVRNQQSRNYINEALTSYRSGAYRASIISTWISVCIDIIEKIKELSGGGDTNANSLEQQLNKINPNDYMGMMNFEKDILNYACDNLGMISVIEKEHLEQLKKDRNICAHPNFSVDGSHYSPTPELTRSYIVQACSYLLINLPVKGKVVINRVLELIEGNTFPSDPENALIVLNSDNNLGRVKDSIIRNLLIVILKKIFKDETPIKQDSMKRILASLIAISRIKPDIYREVMREKLTNLVSETNEKLFLRIFPLMESSADTWGFLKVSERVRIEATIKSMAVSNAIKYNIANLCLKYDWMSQWFLTRLDELELNDKITILKSTPSNVTKKLAIEIFINSKTFDQTFEYSTDVLIPHAGLLDDQDLEKLLLGIHSNRSSWGMNQILDASCIKGVICQLYNESKFNAVRHKEIWLKFWDELSDSNRHWLSELKDLLVEDGVVASDDAIPEDQEFPPSHDISDEVPF